MKSVIDLKLYDTETAHKVARIDNGYPSSDFNWFAETLYKTRRGAYFVHGEGGAMSRFGKRHGDSIGCGEAIWPLCETSAIDWLANNGFTEEITDLFPGKIEEA
jgi:hypothetical protein